MLRRGGFGTGLGERLAIYKGALEFEPCGAVHVHAVSVGESLLALKLIRAWKLRDSDQRFVLATGTATGHAVATAAGIPNVRVTYSPLDFPWMVGTYLKRFEPSRIILIEGEAWPHMLLACRRKQIPVSLVNARMSPRSARRYRRCAAWVRPVFSLLDAVAIQEAEDADIWEDLGVDRKKIHLTGSLKFDPDGAVPTKRPAFQKLLDSFGKRPIVLAASTHQGEDAWIATAIREAAPDALAVIVPRHAERRAEVTAELQAAGHPVVLRSNFTAEEITPSHVLVIDSTGELRDWTAHADVVIIGKTFHETGGQNPCEAILAGKPVVFGPHMENFEPLASRLAASGSCLRVADQNGLVLAIRQAMDPFKSAAMTRHATSVLATHEGATERILDLLNASTNPSK